MVIATTKGSVIGQIAKWECDSVQWLTIARHMGARRPILATFTRKTIQVSIYMHHTSLNARSLSECKTRIDRSITYGAMK